MNKNLIAYKFFDKMFIFSFLNLKLQILNENLLGLDCSVLIFTILILKSETNICC